MPPRSASPAVQRVLDRIGDRVVSGSGSSFKARCPAHEDRIASLSIDEGRDGRVLLNCHAGCAFGDILDALSLTKRDLFNNPERTPDPFPTRASNVAARYDYVDERGQLLFQVERRADKSGFPQRRPDGKGGWIYDLKGARRVPYRLPALIEAVALGKTIYIAEGEKDVHTLERLGYVATTNPGGAGKWRDEYSKTLVGADAVILPDNDEPGRAHAEQLAASLVAQGCRVRIVALPGVREKEDVSDWVARGGTMDALDRLVAATPQWTTHSEAAATKTREQEDRHPRPVRALDVGEPKPIEFAVEDLITAGDIGLLCGDGGSYKTTLGTHLACAIAGGRRAFNRFECQQRPALIVSEEDPEHVIVARARALCRGHGWSETDVLGNLHILALSGVCLSDPDSVSRLLDDVERLDIGFLMLDPLSELIAGDENSSTDSRAVVKAVRRLARSGRTTVLIVHHASKMKEGRRALDRVRGSSAFNAAARFLYFVEPDGQNVSVECLKLSRAKRQDRFVVELRVEASESNRANWQLARLDYMRANVAALTKAEEFVLETLSDAQPLGSEELKHAAEGTGVNAVAVSKALKSLAARGKIDFEPGLRGKKNWRLVTLPEDTGQRGQPVKTTLPTLPAGCPATSDTTTLTLPAPLGAGSGDATHELRGQAGQADTSVACLAESRGSAA